jgi:hypothetical protein
MTAADFITSLLAQLPTGVPPLPHPQLPPPNAVPVPPPWWIGWALGLLLLLLIGLVVWLLVRPKPVPATQPRQPWTVPLFVKLVAQRFFEGSEPHHLQQNAMN